jgi:cellulose synthase/poly-beta-1,6-N-acetylglucosamine synthase-like glycosyltransferase
VSDPADRARALLAAGQLQAADALLAHDCTRSEHLYLRGVIAARKGDHASAARLFMQALAIDPDDAGAWLALGNAHYRSGALHDACVAYERAAALDPGAADIQFNLGVGRRKLDELPSAARAFHRAWRLDASRADAAKACVSTLARWVRSAPHGEEMASTFIDIPSRSSVSVVICSIDDVKAAHATGVYERVLRGIAHQIIVIRDAASLAEAYNRALEHATGDVVVLSHDDIDILAPDFGLRLLGHLALHDVVGVIGATRMTGPLPVWAGHPYLRGWITHRPRDTTEWTVSLVHPEPVADGIAVLDGVLVAARRGVFDAIRFDAATFDGFHCYDLDWSYRAAQAGFRLAAAGDLRVVHASRGTYDDVWARYADRFCAKHRTGDTPPAPPPFYEATFANEADVSTFYARLEAFAAPSSP